jgi:RNA polymerase sigma-70 factor, ECF subfamily
MATVKGIHFIREPSGRDWNDAGAAHKHRGCLAAISLVRARKGKMREETAGRMGKVTTAQISEVGLNEMQDDLLLEEAINGSSAAFGVLFERYQPRVLRVTWRVLRNQEDAEDAAQQTFAHAYAHLRDFQRQSRFSTWLTRIAINDALMLLRKRRWDHVSTEESNFFENEAMTLEAHNRKATPEALYEARELHGILGSAIDELKPLLGKVIELRELAELSTGQTANALGLPIATVKARTFRARRLLRRKLTQRLQLARTKHGESLFFGSRGACGNVRRAKLSMGLAVQA